MFNERHDHKRSDSDNDFPEDRRAMATLSPKSQDRLGLRSAGGSRQDDNNKPLRLRSARKKKVRSVEAVAEYNVLHFMKQAEEMLKAAMRKAETATVGKKGKGPVPRHAYSLAVLAELTTVANEAAKASAAASITAACASTACSAALAAAQALEPMLIPEPEPEPEPEPTATSDEVRWGHTKARSSKILKPLGFLGSGNDAEKELQQRQKKYARKKLGPRELPAVINHRDANTFNATQYARKQAAKVQQAKQRRHSGMAVSLPPVERKKKRATGLNGKVRRAESTQSGGQSSFNSQSERVALQNANNTITEGDEDEDAESGSSGVHT